MTKRMSIRLGGVVLAVAAAMMGLSTIGHAHPFHFSFAEGNWNEETQRLEISLRLEPHDLEDVLRRQTGQAVKLEDEATEKLLEAYLKQSLRVESQAGKPVELVWVGAEVKIKTVWLHFEVPLPQGIEGVKITNTLLLEHLADQVNVMALKQGSKAVAVQFSSKQQMQIVKLRDNPPQEPPVSATP